MSQSLTLRRKSGGSASLSSPHSSQFPLPQVSDTLKMWLSHYVSRTVIHDSVLSVQPAQFHVGCVLGLVCGEVESALGLWCIACSTITRVYPSHPLEPLSRGMSHPVYIVAGEGVSGCLADLQ